MWAERFRLTEKAEAFTSLFDRAMHLRYSPGLCSPLPILRRPNPQYARALRTGKSAESFKRHVDNCLASGCLLDCSEQRSNERLIHVAEKLDREMDFCRLHPGDAGVTSHLRFNSLSQLPLNDGKLSPQLLRQFNAKKRPHHFKPAFFMTVRRQIAEPRREAGARSLGDLRRTRAVH